MRLAKDKKTMGGRSVNSERLFNEIHKKKRLSKYEEIELIKKYQNEGCEDSKRKVMESNLLFCVKVARSHMFDCHKTLSFDDMFGEAYIGMDIAIKRFDISRGSKFISYAVHWMVQRVTEYRNDNRSQFKTPKVSGSIFKGIAECLNQDIEITPSNIYNILSRGTQAKFSVETIRDLLIVSNVDSLDRPTTEELKGEYATIKDIIQDNSMLADQKINDLERYSELRKYITFLNSRERKIIELYFGLGGNLPHVLSEIGEHLNITRERVRQIKNDGIRKLKRQYMKKGGMQKKLF